MKFTKKTVKAKDVAKYDRFKLGGQIYEVTRVSNESFVRSRFLIEAFKVDGDPRFDDITLRLDPHMKLKITRQ